MKKRKLLCILTALFCAVMLVLSACSPAGCGSDTGTTGKTDNTQTGGDVNPPATSGTRIRFDFDGQTVYGTLDDNSVSRDLISRLPLTLTFSDYSGTEKIAYLPDGSPAWDTSDAPDSCTPEVGQIAMYAPWGNLSVFYHSFRQSNGLVPLGKLDEGGAEVFAAMTGDFTVTISLSDDAPAMKEYTVTFDSDGSSAVESQKVYEGNPIKRTVVPTKAGFHFLGWYRDAERTIAWNFDTDHVTSDLTLYAGWEAVTAQKVLVVYFSYSGNTETVAKLIAGESGATLVEIVPTIPYTAADTNYNDSSSRSQVERRNDARPEVADATYAAIDMSKYDVVIIGYPIWNGYEPMIIRTFIEYYNGFTGKEVYTFSTSASSSGSTAFQSVKGRCPAADVKENLHFTRSALSSAENTVEAKLKEWGLSEGENAMPGKIRMRFGGQFVTVTLVDNSATRDLAERLKQAPMTIDFSDFGGSEKIGYPTPALDVSDAEGCDPDVGDLTIYTPWGNLAAFYRDTAGYSESLVLIGRIDGDGIAILAAQSGTFSVTIELIQ